MFIYIDLLPKNAAFSKGKLTTFVVRSVNQQRERNKEERERERAAIRCMGIVVPLLQMKVSREGASIWSKVSDSCLCSCEGKMVRYIHGSCKMEQIVSRCDMWWFG